MGYFALKACLLVWWVRKMTWGTIDDAYHWELAHLQKPIAALFKHLTNLDRDAGMFRPVYSAYMLAGFNIFENQPAFFYAVNWMALIASAVAVAYLWFRVLNVHDWLLVFASVATLFAFDPWVKLFFHVTLQEKLGLIVFPVVIALLRKRHTVVASLVAVAAMLLCKATFIAYGPPLMVFAYFFGTRRQVRVGSLIAVFIAAGIGFLGLRTGYTAHYSPSFSNFVVNAPKAELSTMLMWVVSVPALFSGNRLAITGAIGVFSVSAVVVPWSSSDYYMSLLAPWWLAILAAALAKLSSSARIVAATALGLVGMVGLCVNFTPRLERNYEMGQVLVLFKEIRRTNTEQLAVLEDCHETRDSLNLFSHPDFPNVGRAEGYFVRRLKHYKTGTRALFVSAVGCDHNPVTLVDERPLFQGKYYKVVEAHATVN